MSHEFILDSSAFRATTVATPDKFDVSLEGIMTPDGELYQFRYGCHLYVAIYIYNKLFRKKDKRENHWRCISFLKENKYMFWHALSSDGSAGFWYNMDDEYDAIPMTIVQMEVMENLPKLAQEFLRP